MHDADWNLVQIGMKQNWKNCPKPSWGSLEAWFWIVLIIGIIPLIQNSHFTWNMSNFTVFKENACKNTNTASKIHDFFKIFENTQILVFLIFFLWVTSKIRLRETLTKVLDNIFQICFITIWSKFQSVSCINFHLMNVHAQNDQNAAKFSILNKSYPKWEKNKIFEIWAHNTYFVSDRHNTNMKNVLWNLKKLFRQVVNTYEHFEGVKNLKFVKYLKFLFWFDLLHTFRFF